DRAVDEQPRRRSVDLGEHLRTVVELQQPVAAAADQLVGLRGRFIGPFAQTLAALDDKQLATDAVPVDDREQGCALAGMRKLGQTREQAHSIRSRKTSISPPQGSPTDHASSSAIP